MDPRLAQSLPDTLRKAGDAQLRRVSEEVTIEAQRRKDAEAVPTAEATLTDESGYGHGV